MSEEKTYKDGIYLNLPESDYHEITRLSSSGIGNLLTSPSNFWFNSWLNPDKVDKDTQARVLGRAYHTARLEPHRLSDLFYSELDKDDYEDGLLTDISVKKELKSLGETQSIAGENALDRAIRLEDCDYDGKIYCIDRAELERANEGKTPIPAKCWKDIQIDMGRIKNSPEISALLSDGLPEVSILWTCPDSGIKMKARLDFLKPTEFIDFKTFQNSLRKMLDQAVIDAFKYNRYYIQNVIYFQAISAICQNDLLIVDKSTAQADEIISAIKANKKRMESWYIFQEKGGIPNLIAYKIALFNQSYATQVNSSGASDGNKAKVVAMTTTKSALLIKAIAEITHAKKDFLTYSEVYSDGEAWQPISPLREITDYDFSNYWLDGDI